MLQGFGRHAIDLHSNDVTVCRCC